MKNFGGFVNVFMWHQSCWIMQKCLKNVGEKSSGIECTKKLEIFLTVNMQKNKRLLSLYTKG